MIITFWGVRGSTPVPCHEMLRYGGNTACVSVEVGRKVLVLDAGTGIRRLGDELVGNDHEIFVLLSHVHSDHINGFPFFAPLFEAGRILHLLNYQHGISWSLLDLIDGIHFPIQPRQLPSACLEVEGDAADYLRSHGFEVARLPVNHPGGAYGYRVAAGGHRFVYIPDNELDPPQVTTSFEETVAFCRGADVLCHDAQFVAADLPNKHGWGHSRVADACRLAIAAEAKHLVLFHHDPQRTDAEIDALQARASEQLRPHGIVCTAAYEGLRFNLEVQPLTVPGQRPVQPQSRCG